MELKQALQDVLINDEGYKDHTYVDHLGYPSFGIGHKVTGTDPEYGKPEGTPVSAQRIAEAFHVDVNDCIAGARMVDENYFNRPIDAQVVLACMVYQMGTYGVSKFKNMLKSLARDNYEAASVHMLDSKWYTQTPKRATRLARRMKSANRDS